MLLTAFRIYGKKFSMIIVIKHIEIEGPGTIEDYLTSQGFSLKTANLHQGERLPDDLSTVEAVITLGGPMNVYEEDKYPFLKDEDAFLKKVLREEIPTLGICLGSQLIAKACGAKVVKSPMKEVGWSNIELEKSAQTDPLFQGLKGSVDVYQWHEDMWQLPQGAVLLATGEGCPHQAFRVGSGAYGVQFHVEITERMIRDWCREYFKSEDKEKQKLANEMISLYPKKEKTLQKSCRIIYQNFVNVMAQRRQQVRLAEKA